MAIPFLFIPGFGFGVPTPFGKLEIIDFLIGPFLLFLFFSPKANTPTYNRDVARIGAIFILWSFATVLWIYLGYTYREPIPVVIFSLLKLAKFTLYGFTGIYMTSRLTTDDLRVRFNYAILAVGVVMGLSLAFLGSFAHLLLDLDKAYEVGNIMSVSLCNLLVYIFVLYVKQYGTSTWRKLAVPTLVIMALGAANSGGRGGWLAALVGIGYALFFMNIKVRNILMGIAVAVTGVLMYFTVEDFHREIDKTLFPDQKYLDTYQKIGVGGVDDGGRLSTWVNEAAKIPKSPIFGTGFYHRGGDSGIWATGSHNFWLQMFLETGLIGGFMVLFLFLKMWKHAKNYYLKDDKVGLAVKAALLTAFIGGLSGEYFYGSYGLLTLMLIYASVGSEPREVHTPEMARSAS
jgi:O-antigen ligase